MVEESLIMRVEITNYNYQTSPPHLGPIKLHKYVYIGQVNTLNVMKRGAHIIVMIKDHALQLLRNTDVIGLMLNYPSPHYYRILNRSDEAHLLFTYVIDQATGNRQWRLIIATKHSYILNRNSAHSIRDFVYDNGGTEIFGDQTAAN